MPTSPMGYMQTITPPVVIQNITTIPVEITPPIEHNETENEVEYDMLKILDAVSQNITLDTIKNGMRNLLFDGTYWYIADITVNIAALNLYIYRYNSDWSNKTTVYSFSSGGSSAGSAAVPCIRILNGVYHCGFCYTLGLGFPTDYYLYDITSATGASGSWSTAVSLSSTTSRSSIDMVLVGATVIYVMYDPIDNRAYLNDGSTYYTDSGRNGVISGAYSDGTYVYFLSYKAADTTYMIRKWDAVGGFVSESTPTLSNGAQLATDTSQLWKTGSSYIIGWVNTVWYKPSSTWQQLIVPTAANPVPHWYLDSGS
jgi:hypothetical protein